MSYGERIACHDDELDLVECRDAIARCLRGLPPGQRQIVFMRYREDLTQSEIGARIGMSQMQVSRLLRRTLQHMQMLAARSDRPEIPGPPRERAQNGGHSTGRHLSPHAETVRGGEQVRDRDGPGMSYVVS